MATEARTSGWGRITIPGGRVGVEATGGAGRRQSRNATLRAPDGGAMVGATCGGPMSKPDRLTVICVAILAYALGNVLHEGLGHGGACVVTGCSAHLLTALHFDGDEASLSAGAIRLIAA